MVTINKLSSVVGALVVSAVLASGPAHADGRSGDRAQCSILAVHQYQLPPDDDDHEPFVTDIYGYGFGQKHPPRVTLGGVDVSHFVDVMEDGRVLLVWADNGRGRPLAELMDELPGPPPLYETWPYWDRFSFTLKIEPRGPSVPCPPYVLDWLRPPGILYDPTTTFARHTEGAADGAVHGTL